MSLKTSTRRKSTDFQDATSMSKDVLAPDAKRIRWSSIRHLETGIRINVILVGFVLDGVPSVLL